MPLTPEYRDLVIDHMLRGIAFEPPQALFAGLLHPGSDIELRGDTYMRQGVRLGPPQSGLALSAVDVGFPRASENWGLVRSVGLFDVAAGGMMLAVCPLDLSFFTPAEDGTIPEGYDITAGAQFSLPAGKIWFDLE